MKRILTAVVALILVTANLPLVTAAAGEQELPVLKAESAAVIEQETGKLLFGKNPDQKMYPASTTKNLTALLALENLNLEDTAVVGEELKLVNSDASDAGLKTGQKLTVRELIWALMLPSGNDAAYTLAVQVARKQSGNAAMGVPEAVTYFAGMMNKRAEELGAKNSHFANPDGYHAEDHYSTAHDLALISREAMKQEFFREVVGTWAYGIKEAAAVQPGASTKGNPQVWLNKNELINSQGKHFYEYANGIKTGHTSSAGFCLAASAARNGMDLIAVVLKDPVEESRWLDTKALMEYGFNHFKKHTLVQKGQFICSAEVGKKYSGKTVQLDLVAGREYSDIMNLADIDHIEQNIQLKTELLFPSKGETNGMKLLGPIQQGQAVGTVTYTLDGKVLAEADLLASSSAMNTATYLDILAALGERVYEDRVIIGGCVAFAVVIVLLFKTGRSMARKRAMTHKR